MRAPGFSVAPQKPGSSSGIIVLVVVLALIVPMIGIFAVLAIYGVRKYIANAKTAEARYTLGSIGKHAAAAYEEDRHLCASASSPIPARRNAISAVKYMSTSSEWQADHATNAGFACLKFEMSTPQYFQYDYQSTSTGFTARAYGDLNGDGVFSTFELEGRIVNDTLLIAPAIKETNPQE